jgi:deoxyribonuclease V
MDHRIHHPWNVTPSEALRIQSALKKRLFLSPIDKKIRFVGGGDVAYSKRDDRMFGAMVVLSLPDLAVVDEAWHVGTVRFPYIPGFLSFREGPILLEVAKKIHQSPDVWIFDGQGIAHPRGIGLASHMGLLLDCPSIGCAKKRLVGDHNPVGHKKGDFEILVAAQGAPGFRIDLEESIELVLRTCEKYRMPEPLRQTHLLSNRIRKEMAG